MKGGVAGLGLTYPSQADPVFCPAVPGKFLCSPCVVPNTQDSKEQYKTLSILHFPELTSSSVHKLHSTAFSITPCKDQLRWVSSRPPVRSFQEPPSQTSGVQGDCHVFCTFLHTLDIACRDSDLPCTKVLFSHLASLKSGSHFSLRSFSNDTTAGFAPKYTCYLPFSIGIVW